MSGHMTNVEIEDVLSSIRRLVSEDARPAGREQGAGRGRPATPQVPPSVRTMPSAAAAEKLVLTPAYRVPDDIAPETPPAAGAAGLSAAGLRGDGQGGEGQGGEGPGGSGTAGAVTDLASLEDTIAELEAAVAASNDAWEPDGSESVLIDSAYQPFEADAGAAWQAADAGPDAGPDAGAGQDTVQDAGTGQVAGPSVADGTDDPVAAWGEDARADTALQVFDRGAAPDAEFGELVEGAAERLADPWEEPSAEDAPFLLDATDDDLAGDGDAGTVQAFVSARERAVQLRANRQAAADPAAKVPPEPMPAAAGVPGSAAADAPVAALAEAAAEDVAAEVVAAAEVAEPAVAETSLAETNLAAQDAPESGRLESGGLESGEPEVGEPELGKAGPAELEGAELEAAELEPAEADLAGLEPGDAGPEAVGFSHDDRPMPSLAARPQPTRQPAVVLPFAAAGSQPVEVTTADPAPAAAAAPEPSGMAAAAASLVVAPAPIVAGNAANAAQVPERDADGQVSRAEALRRLHLDDADEFAWMRRAPRRDPSDAGEAGAPQTEAASRLPDSATPPDLTPEAAAPDPAQAAAETAAAPDAVPVGGAEARDLAEDVAQDAVAADPAASAAPGAEAPRVEGQSATEADVRAGDLAGAPSAAASAAAPADAAGGETDDFSMFDDDETVLDEAALRDLITTIIREELQGVLGERITRNVRKLVRAEIQRALASRDFE